MNLISISSEKSLIIREKDISKPAGNHSDRLITVLNYMKENLAEQITLQVLPQ